MVLTSSTPELKASMSSVKLCQVLIVSSSVVFTVCKVILSSDSESLNVFSWVVTSALSMLAFVTSFLRESIETCSNLWKRQCHRKYS